MGGLAADFSNATEACPSVIFPMPSIADSSTRPSWPAEVQPLAVEQLVRRPLSPVQGVAGRRRGGGSGSTRNRTRAGPSRPSQLARVPSGELGRPCAHQLAHRVPHQQPRIRPTASSASEGVGRRARPRFGRAPSGARDESHAPGGQTPVSSEPRGGLLRKAKGQL